MGQTVIRRLVKIAHGEFNTQESLKSEEPWNQCGGMSHGLNTDIRVKGTRCNVVLKCR